MKHSFKLKETFHYPFFEESLSNELTLRKRASAKMTNFTNSISKGTKKAAFVIKVWINLSKKMKKKSKETIQLSLTSFPYNIFFVEALFQEALFS